MSRTKLYFLALLCLWPSVSLAADKCYETIPATNHMDCSGSKSRSADFTVGCTLDSEPTVVEVPCEAEGRWVNIYNQPFNPSPRPRPGDWMPYMPIMFSSHPTHSKVCSTAGLKPGNLEGAKCASARRRPTAGEGWSDINYVYGVYGGSNGGGTQFSIDRASLASSLSGRNIQGGYCHKGSYEEIELDMAVAFYCVK